MAPTTFTTLVLIAFAMGLIALALYGWLGSWEFATRRVTPAKVLEREYQAGVQEMRRAIEDYERGRRTL